MEKKYGTTYTNNHTDRSIIIETRHEYENMLLFGRRKRSILSIIYRFMCMTMCIFFHARGIDRQRRCHWHALLLLSVVIVILLLLSLLYDISCHMINPLDPNHRNDEQNNKNEKRNMNIYMVACIPLAGWSNSCDNINVRAIVIKTFLYIFLGLFFSFLQLALIIMTISQLLHKNLPNAPIQTKETRKRRKTSNIQCVHDVGLQMC